MMGCLSRCGVVGFRSRYRLVRHLPPSASRNRFRHVPLASSSLLPLQSRYIASDASSVPWSATASSSSIRHKHDKALSRFSSVEELTATTDANISCLESPSQHVHMDDDTKNILRKYRNAFVGWMELSRQGYGMDAAEKAHSLLDLIEKSSLLPLDVVDYGMVLNTYANSSGGSDETAAERAQDLVQRMMTRCREYYSNESSKHQSQKPSPVVPNTRVFNTLINCWTKSRSVDAGVRAEAVYAMMTHWDRECRVLRVRERGYSFRGSLPDAVSVNSVVEAWSKSGHANAPDRVLEILNHSIAEKHRLNERAFNCAIRTCLHSRRGRGGVEIAEGLLKTIMSLDQTARYKGMVVPNGRTFSAVIDGWTKVEETERTGDAAKRAEAILVSMVRLCEQLPTLKPNEYCFASVINAWSKCRSPDAPENAERILDAMIHDESLKPTVVAFNTVITTWARSSRRDSVPRAEGAFAKLQSFVKPDLISWNALLDSYAKKGMGEKALRILEELEEASSGPKGPIDGSSAPDVVLYTTVLQAMARDTKGEWAKTAETLVNRMVSLSSKGRRNNVKPNQHTFSVLLNIWSRSGAPNDAAASVSKAHELVQYMIKLFEHGDATMKPNTATLTTLIKVCANGGAEGRCDAEKAHALKVALETMALLESSCYGPPNYISYATLIQAVDRLSVTKSSKFQLLRSIFQKCIATKQVSRTVLAQMELASMPIVQPLDPDWSEHVPPHDRPF